MVPRSQRLVLRRIGYTVRRPVYTHEFKSSNQNLGKAARNARQNRPLSQPSCRKWVETRDFATFFQHRWFYTSMARYRTAFWVVGFCLTAVAGYWLARSAAPVRSAKVAEAVVAPAGASEPEEAVAFRHGDRPVFRSDVEALKAGALPGQRGLVFKDGEALDRFVAKASGRLRILGRIDGLHALQVGFLNPDDLAGLLDGTEDQSMIYPAYVPNPKPAMVQSGAVVAVGNQLLSVLGINSDNSNWGKGVLVAILDTGVSPNQAFGSAITSLNLVPLPANLADWNGHGTAVASLIIGRDTLTPGVAPGADILSVRIADDLGQSDTMLIARGIVSAVDAGAAIINISLGSSSDSPIVRNAIDYANKAGVAIVASAGNDGLGQLAFPAGNAGVIAVGAVDAVGTSMAFSNSGNTLAAAAPGYLVNAAWTGDQAVGFTGTSASAPIMVGAIAAAMSSGGATLLSAGDAMNLVLTHLNDVGAPGTDAATGGGMVDVGRVMQASTSGIYDAAVASNWVIPPSADVPYPQLQVVIQNRGTEMLVNVGVQVTTPGGTVPLNVTTLMPNAVQTFTLPLPSSSWTSATPLKFDSSVWLGGGQTDANPSNNRRIDSYVPPAN